MNHTTVHIASLLLVYTFMSYGCSKRVSSVPARPGLYQTVVSSTDTRLELKRETDAFIGSGIENGRAFTVAAVVSWRAEGLMVFEDGSTQNISLRENPDGSLLLVDQGGTAFTLSPSESVLNSPPTGKFSGHYADTSLERPLTLDLLQIGAFINGFGRYGDEPVHVAGKVKSDGSITATLYFGDDSTVGIRASTNAGGDVIKVTGLGKGIKLLKQS